MSDSATIPDPCVHVVRDPTRLIPLVAFSISYCLAALILIPVEGVFGVACLPFFRV